MLDPGTVLCRKTTGELCIVIKETSQEGVDLIVVRRPVMTHENGISHSLEGIFAFELETVEAHLRREAKEMVLKSQIQDEMMQELENSKKKPGVKELVN